jgi:hypothetical protein
MPAPPRISWCSSRNAENRGRITVITHLSICVPSAAEITLDIAALTVSNALKLRACMGKCGVVMPAAIMLCEEAAIWPEPTSGYRIQRANKRGLRSVFARRLGRKRSPLAAVRRGGTAVQCSLADSTAHSGERIGGTGGRPFEAVTGRGRGWRGRDQCSDAIHPTTGVAERLAVTNERSLCWIAASWRRSEAAGAEFIVEIRELASAWNLRT